MSCLHTPHLADAMSESAGAEGTSGCSDGGVALSSSPAGRGVPSPPADPLAAGEAIDEVLTENDSPKAYRKRKYPGFTVERSGVVGGRGSYTVRFKLRVVAYTRALCSDGIWEAMEREKFSGWIASASSAGSERRIG